MDKRVIKMLIAYDGTDYSGFQRQSNALSVQEVLERVFRRVFGEADLTLVAAGRTDAGVHANGQIVSVRTAGKIAVESIVPACNGILPCSISVKKAEEMSWGFHALRNACGKLYMYRIYNSKFADPFINRYAWQVRKKLLFDAMIESAKLLIGTHDFAAFRSASNSQTDSIRTVYNVELQKDAVCPDVLNFSISGNGFLYHMVRNIVGAVVEVGKGKMTVNEFYNVFKSCDRSKYGYTAPPQGLFLQEVYYD